MQNEEWIVEGGGESDDAAAADEVVDAGLFDPAFGFGGFEFELGDGFDGVTWRTDFGVGGIELEGGVDGAGEGAVGFLVETGRASRVLVRRSSDWGSVSRGR